MIRNGKRGALIATCALGLVFALFSSEVSRKTIDVLAEGIQLGGRSYRILIFGALTIAILLLAGCVVLSLSVVKRGERIFSTRRIVPRMNARKLPAGSMPVAGSHKLRPRIRFPKANIGSHAGKPSPLS